MSTRRNGRVCALLIMGTTVLAAAACSPTPAPAPSSPATTAATPAQSTAPLPAEAPAASATSSDYRECSPESRHAEVCTQIYAPVCAELDTGVRCVRAPCPESKTQRTAENACRACSDPKTYGYRPGPCSSP